MTVERYDAKRFALFDDNGALLCVTAYRKGAVAVQAVIEGLEADIERLEIEVLRLERELVAARRQRQLALPFGA